MIRRAVSDLPGRVEVRSTKTGLIRRMALDEATSAVLEAQRDLAVQRCAAVGAALNPEAYVWSQEPDYSEPMRPGRITSWFAELRDELGMTGMRFHHLRHFAATIMLAGGVDVRTVAGRLGHARPTLTLQTYAHVMEATDRRAAEIVGDSIAAGRGAAVGV
jgi:integrase